MNHDARCRLLPPQEDVPTCADELADEKARVQIMSNYLDKIDPFWRERVKGLLR